MSIILILSGWWLFWVSASVYLNSALHPVSDQVLVLTLLFVSSFFGGGFLASKAEPFNLPRQPSYKSLIFVSSFALTILMLIQLPVWSVLFKGWFSGLSATEIRHLIFYDSQMSKWHRLLFSYSSAITNNYIMILSMVSLTIYKKKAPLILAVIYFLFISLVKGSRAEIYQLIMISALYFFSFYGFVIFNFFRKNILISLALFSSLMVAVMSISLARDHDIFIGTFQYHIVGFVLLSKYVDGLPGSVLREYSLGVSYFGGVDYLVGLVAKMFFWENFESFTKNAMFLEAQEWRTGVDARHNTFFTLIVTGLKSFGAYGVITMGIVLGSLISRLVCMAKLGDLRNNSYLILLLSLVLMGVFSSGLETVGFWLTLIFINVIQCFSIRMSAN